jgi:DNA-directed RNA polymerase subunit N (RpoN/RPB10)
MALRLRQFSRRRTALVASIAALACGVAGMIVWTVGISSAAAVPATPAFGRSIDGYAAYDGQDTCDPTAKPGVIGFRDLLNRTYGVHTAYIGRSCDTAGVSEHEEGRALDYMLNVNNATQRDIANTVLNWLLATDQYGNRHALARRLGVMYIIWNRQQWRSYRPGDGWQPYSGSNPHTDHIHISFSWPGARKQTSWWSAAATAPVNGIVSGDVTGDGYADMVGRRADGTLWLYTNAGAASPTQPYGTGRLIGSAWQQFSWFVTGDVTGDRRADLVAARPDGTLLLYENGGSNTEPYTTGRVIGSAWHQFSNITLADVTGDGRAEMIAARSDGTLLMYLNSGSNTAPYSTGQLIGTDWQQFSYIMAQDVTGDGRADIVAARPNGSLYLYVNGGSDTEPYSTGRVIGSGWQQFNRIAVTDVNGDRRADVVATRPDGTLLMYVNGGSNMQPYSTGRQIGTGWQIFG